MTKRIIGAAVACVLSASATAAFGQQAAGGSDPFHMQPPTSQPPTAMPPRLQTPQPATAPPGRQTPRATMPPTRFEGHFDNPNGPQAFSVVLVVGEMEGAPAADNVPAAARKALTDLKDFLPYKNYRLLDSQWTLCCGRGAIFSRLRGLDEQEYELQLTPSISGAANSQQPVVNVRFVLTEAGSSAPKVAASVSESRRRAELQKEIADLERQRQELSAKQGERSPVVVETRNALEMRVHELETMSAQGRNITVATSRGHRQVIDASFRMDVGETVVVGTSRIQGDKALIALLTAVPPKGGTAR